MANKSYTGRRLANTFPQDTAIRLDTESVGQRFFHAIGTPMDKMDKELFHQRANQYPSTFNVDEVAVLHRVDLPVDFSFSYLTDDPVNIQYEFPSVDGLFINDTVSGWFTISGVNSNTLEEFWYETAPTRATLDTTSTNAHTLVSPVDITTFPKTTVSDPHLPGHLIIDVDAAGNSLVNTDNEFVRRGKVTVIGTTRKDTEESETIVFPWTMKQKTLQQWKEIEKIEAYDFPSGVMIGVYSGDFANGPYWDAYNLGYSEYRNKVDIFWDVGVVGTVPTLDKVGHISDEWKVLITGNDQKEVKRSWETLDQGGATVSGVDLAVQPFSTWAWVVDANNQLYCYDLAETIADRIDLIGDRTSGSHVKLDFEAKHVVMGETIKFYPYYERPLVEVDKYRLWYETPSGDQYGLLSGTPVSISSNFWTRGSEIIDRRLEGVTSVTATERGDWLFVVEVVYNDGVEHTYKALVTVDYKTPVTQIDLSSMIASTIDGIDFDSDQRIWVRSGSTYYRLNLHADKMLIDYTNKVIYFREDYREVDVT